MNARPGRKGPWAWENSTGEWGHYETVRGRTSLWEWRLAYEDSAVGHHALPLGCPGRAADLFFLHCYYPPVRGKLLNGSARTCTSYKDILEHGSSHGMRLNFALHYYFFPFNLEYIVLKACFMSPAKANHLGPASIIHHIQHFDPVFRLRLEMTELPPYVKSAFTLFTVSFHPWFTVILEVLNALLKVWVYVYNTS